LLGRRFSLVVDPDEKCVAPLLLHFVGKRRHAGGLDARFLVEIEPYLAYVSQQPLKKEEVG
jgi:hypothetical protein